MIFVRQCRALSYLFCPSIRILTNVCNNSIMHEQQQRANILGASFLLLLLFLSFYAQFILLLCLLSFSSVDCSRQIVYLKEIYTAPLPYVE